MWAYLQIATPGCPESTLSSHLREQVRLAPILSSSIILSNFTVPMKLILSLSQIWSELCEAALETALEGFSRIKKCSAEGRLSMALDLSDLKIGLEQIRAKAPLIPLHSTSTLPSLASSSSPASPGIVPNSSSSSSSTTSESEVNKIQNSHITFLDSEKEVLLGSKIIIEAKQRVDSFIHATYLPEEGKNDNNCFIPIFMITFFQV